MIPMKAVIRHTDCSRILKQTAFQGNAGMVHKMAIKGSDQQLSQCSFTNSFHIPV